MIVEAGKHPQLVGVLLHVRYFPFQSGEEGLQCNTTWPSLKTVVNLKTKQISPIPQMTHVGV